MLLSVLRQAKWPSEIFTASTTEEARRIIDREPEIVAAFIDYYIPSERGPAVIRYLKAKIPQARIALVSSSDNPKNAAEAREAGAEAVVCTSHPASIVMAVLTDLLERWETHP